MSHRGLEATSGLSLLKPFLAPKGGNDREPLRSQPPPPAAAPNPLTFCATCYLPPGSPKLCGYFTFCTTHISTLCDCPGFPRLGQCARQSRASPAPPLAFPNFKLPRYYLAERVLESCNSPRSCPAAGEPQGCHRRAPGMPPRGDAHGILLPTAPGADTAQGPRQENHLLAPKPFLGQLEGCLSAFPPSWRVSGYQAMQKTKKTNKKTQGKNKVRESNSPQNNNVI